MTRISPVLILISFCLAAQAEPDWWTSPQTAIWDGTTTGEDFAPVNVGQLKSVATQAKTYLESVLGPVDWEAAYFGSGIDSPFPFSIGEDFSPLNVGQLKAISYGFYNILDSKGYPTSIGLQRMGCPLSSISDSDGFALPWNGASLSNECDAFVNIGQLKLVFSFDLSDSDLDGLFDLWESEFGFDPLNETDAEEDFDTDGLSNLNEQLLGTNPLTSTVIGSRTETYYLVIF